MKACASPSGSGLPAYWKSNAPLAPSPSRRWNCGWSSRRGDDQDLADAGEHQRRQRIIDHRLVVDRQQLLADASVIGYSRVPEPPASTMPFVIVMIRSRFTAPVQLLTRQLAHARPAPHAMAAA